MSVEEISNRWKSFIIPDLGTIHHPMLIQAIKDVQFLLAKLSDAQNLAAARAEAYKDGYYDNGLSK